MLERPIFEGDLRRIQIADVLSFIAMIRTSGKLVLRQARLQRTLHWIEGEIVFARSNSPDQSLAHLRLRNGKMTQQQDDDSKQRIAPNQRHGTELRRIAALPPPT